MPLAMRFSRTASPVIGLVGQKLARWWCGVEHDGQHPDVCGLPGCEREDERAPLAVAQGMDLSRSTTAGATNRLTLLPPFFGTCRRTVRLDVGAVGKKLAVRAPVSGQSGVDALPDALPGPAVEGIVDRRVGAVFRRAVAPAAAAPKHMDDPTEDAPVIDTRRATIVRQQRLDLRPLLVIQPEQAAHGTFLSHEPIEPQSIR